MVVLDGAPTGPLRAALEALEASGRTVQRVLQRGHGFGPRFVAALADAASLGFQRLAIVGTDIPELTADDLGAALASSALSIGPARDGGFYLLGLDAGQLDLLDGPLPWQQPNLSAALIDRAHAVGLEVERLTTREDLDTPDAVRRHLSAVVRLVRETTGRDLGARVADLRLPRLASVVGRASQVLQAGAVAPRGPPFFPAFLSA